MPQNKQTRVLLSFGCPLRIRNVAFDAGRVNKTRKKKVCTLYDGQHSHPVSINAVRQQLEIENLDDYIANAEQGLISQSFFFVSAFSHWPAGFANDMSRIMIG